MMKRLVPGVFDSLSERNRALEAEIEALAWAAHATPSVGFFKQPITSIFDWRKIPLSKRRHRGGLRALALTVLATRTVAP